MELLAGMSLEKWVGFLLVVLRAGALMVALPFFGSRAIPWLVRAGLTLALALVMYPLAVRQGFSPATNLWALGVAGAREVLVGATMGISVRLVLTGVQIMGQLVGFQMGFAVANVFDPVSGAQISVVAQFAYLTGLLVFLALGGYRQFFLAMAESMRLVPVGTAVVSGTMVGEVMRLAAGMFSIALRIGAPVIGALLFTQVAMGILAKTVPQMNILIVGFPLTITIGLIFLALTLGAMVPVLGAYFSDMSGVLIRLIRGM